MDARESTTAVHEPHYEPTEVGDSASPGPQGRAWPLTPGSTLGQIVRPHHDSLCAIEFLVTLGARFDGTLTCHVQTDDGQILHIEVDVAVAGLADNRFVRFPLPPLPGSAGRALYAWLETDAPGLGVYTCGPYGSYGARRDHAPIATSLVYRTFAAGPDARWSDRATIEHLLAAQADLTHDLLAARQAVQRLTDERTALERGCGRCCRRLVPPLVDRQRD